MQKSYDKRFNLLIQGVEDSAEKRPILLGKVLKKLKN